MVPPRHGYFGRNEDMDGKEAHVIPLSKQQRSLEVQRSQSQEVPMFPFASNQARIRECTCSLFSFAKTPMRIGEALITYPPMSIKILLHDTTTKCHQRECQNSHKPPDDLFPQGTHLDAVEFSTQMSHATSATKITRGWAKPGLVGLVGERGRQQTENICEHE